MKKFAKILLACLCLLLASVAALLGYSEWTVSDARHYTYDDVDAVPYNRVALVLGTSKYLIGGSPNHYFKYRIKAAAELYNNGKVDYILVSGDNATVQYNEPRQMRRALIQAGIPAKAIYSDYAGFRTLDSIVRAKEVFGQARFTVVSQAFHNERAIFIAAPHQGTDIAGNRVGRFIGRLVRLPITILGNRLHTHAPAAVPRAVIKPRRSSLTRDQYLSQRLHHVAGSIALLRQDRALGQRQQRGRQQCSAQGGADGGGGHGWLLRMGFRW